MKKNTLPHANVGVYLSYSTKPYFEAKTDENGYYEIPSERLPNSPYDVQYSTVVGGKQTTSTAKFIAQNDTYLKQNNINLNNNKTGSRKNESTQNLSGNSVNKPSTQSGLTNFPTKNEGTNGTNFSPTAAPSAKNSSLTNATSQKNSILFIVAILLFLIGGAGGLLAFYLMKKNKQQTNMY
jgi:hypothetical protein